MRFVCGIEGKPPADLARAEPRATSSDLHIEANTASIRELAKAGKVQDNKALDALAGTDRMSLDLTLEGTPEISKDTASTRDVVLIGPDSSRTWIVFAHDEATAVARLKSVLAGASTLVMASTLPPSATSRLSCSDRLDGESAAVDRFAHGRFFADELTVACLHLAVAA